MAHAHKLNITRPTFLLQLMGGDVDRLTNDSMRDPLWNNTALSYCAYTVLMEANVSESQIDRVSDDGESVAVRFSKSVDVQDIAAQCNKEQVRYGSHTYRVHTKVRDRYIIFEISKEASVNTG